MTTRIYDNTAYRNRDAYQSDKGKSCLYDDCIYGNINAIKSKFDTNQVDLSDLNDFNNPLFWVGKGGNVQCLKYLLSKIKTTEQMMNELFGIIAENGHVDMMNYLYKRRPHKYSLYNALIYASSSGHLNVVRYLYKNGVIPFPNILREVDLYENPLVKASANGHKNIVEFFVQKCNDGTWKNYGGMALMKATIAHHIDIVKYLVEKGANMLFNYRAYSSWKIASQKNFLDIIKVFEENGFQLNSYWIEMLPYCLKSGLTGILEYIVSSGIDISGKKDEIYLKIKETGSVIFLRFYVNNNLHTKEQLDELFQESKRKEWKNLQLFMTEELGYINEAELFNLVPKEFDIIWTETCPISFETIQKDSKIVISSCCRHTFLMTSVIKWRSYSTRTDNEKCPYCGKENMEYYINYNFGKN